MLISAIPACLGIYWAAGALWLMRTKLKLPVWIIPSDYLLYAWTTSYLIASLAIWRQWVLRQKDERVSLLWYLLHYLFGLMWPYALFGQQKPMTTLILLAFWWGSAIGWTRATRQISRFATTCALLCWTWALYVMLLTLEVIRINKGISTL